MVMAATEKPLMYDSKVQVTQSQPDLFNCEQILLKAGESTSLQMTESVNLILVETGNLVMDSLDDQVLLEPGTLLVVEASRYSLTNIHAQNDALFLSVSLSQNMLSRFRQRYAEALIETQKRQENNKNNASSPLFFYGCDLTRMAIISFRLVQHKKDIGLHALKLEELLLLQLPQPKGYLLADFLLSSCDPATTKFREYVETNYLNHWSLAIFAKNAAMSLTAFKAQFNQVYHTSPRAWINEKRLRFADELLRTSSKRIIEIALEAGFSSQSYFTQAYKARFGCTPSEVRQSA